MSSSLYSSVSFVYTTSPHPCHALWATGHITRVLPFTFQLVGTSASALEQWCLPILTQQEHQRLAAWAAPAEHGDCHVPHCHLTWGWTEFWSAEWRNYIQKVLIPLSRVKRKALSTYLIHILKPDQNMLAFYSITSINVWCITIIYPKRGMHANVNPNVQFI